MFIGLLVLAVLAYGLQNTLMADLFRKHDLLSLVAMRGLSLLVVMSPLLFAADPTAWSTLPHLWLPLTIACIAACVANLSQATAVRHLPVGIAYALCMVISTLLQVGYGLFWLGEEPGTAGLIMAAVVLALTVMLAQGNKEPRSETARPMIGIAASLLFGASMASALGALIHVSRGADPFLAAWAWEGGIGLIALLLLILRRPTGTPIGLTNATLWRRTTLFAAPTLIGTGGYAWATTMGDLSIAAAVISTVMVASAVCARWYFNERLLPRQWALIVAICLAVCGLELLRI